MKENRIALTLIFHQGKFLLVRENYATWEHPGGLAMEGETFEDAAVRETFEETGLVVKTSKLINSYYDKKHTELFVKKIYLASVVGGKLKKDKEFQLFSLNELPSNISLEAKQSVLDCVSHRFGQTYYPEGRA
ncbi:MAG: NUDIX domain-containing protein [Candidatus Woesearchaeota archaeon]